MIGGQFRSLANVGGAAAVGAGLTAGWGVLTARLLGPEGQGILSFVSSTAAIATLICAGGSGIALRVASRGRPSPHLQAAFRQVTLLGGLAAGLVLLAVTPLSGLDPSSWSFALMFLLGTAVFAGRQSADYLQAFGRTSAAIFTTSVGGVVQIVLALCALAAGLVSVNMALVCLIAGGLAQMFFALRTEPLSPTRGRGRGSLCSGWLLVRRGIPSLGFGFALLLLQRIDRILLVVLAGPVAAGHYVVATAVSELGRVVSGSSGQLLFARRSENHHRAIDVLRIYVAASVLHLGVLLFLYGVGRILIVPVFGEMFAPALDLLAPLLLAELFMGQALMDSRIVLAGGRLGPVSVAALLVAALALPVYWLMIASHGAVGAATASVLLYGVLAVALFFLRVKVERFKQE